MPLDPGSDALRGRFSIAAKANADVCSNLRESAARHRKRTAESNPSQESSHVPLQSGTRVARVLPSYARVKLSATK